MNFIKISAFVLASIFSGTGDFTGNSNTKLNDLYWYVTNLSGTQLIALVDANNLAISKDQAIENTGCLVTAMHSCAKAYSTQYTGAFPVAATPHTDQIFKN